MGAVAIDTSYTTGAVTGSGLSVGGLVGNTDRPLSITESYATGTVTGLEFVGGLAGTAATMSATSSYTTGDVTGVHYVGGFAGGTYGPFVASNSYVTSQVTGSAGVGGFVGRPEGSVTTSASYCLEEGSYCGSASAPAVNGDPNPVPGVPLASDDLKSPTYLMGQGWNFDQVWCVRDSLNDGYPVLRAIDFGPGNTNNCREPSTIVPIWRASLDPNGGTCVDGATRSEPWNSVFVGYRYLPGPSDCTRAGYTFDGWADQTTPSTIKGLPLLVDPSSNTRRYFVADNLDLVAVWIPVPAPKAITDLVVFANFLCGPCTTAWLIYTSPPLVTNVSMTIDDTPATCARSGIVFGLSVCELTNLAPGIHTVTLAPTGGTPTSTTITLRK